MRTRYLNRFLIVVMSICAWQFSHAQISATKIEHVDSLMALSPKPLLLLISTEWCKYCEMQKQQIRENQKFKDLSDNLYFIEFDAERKDKITYQGKEYSFKPTGVNIGTHELAFELNGSTKISYPSWVLLDRQYQPIFRHNGFLNPQQVNELIEGIVETFKNN